MATEAIRISRLRRWWNSASSTVTTSTWEARFWVGFAVLGIGWKGLAASVPTLFFISCWANVKGALNQAQGAKREMLEEEAEEASPGNQAGADSSIGSSTPAAASSAAAPRSAEASTPSS